MRAVFRVHEPWVICKAGGTKVPCYMLHVVFACVGSSSLISGKIMSSTDFLIII